MIIYTSTNPWGTMRIRALISGSIGLILILSVYLASPASETSQEIVPEMPEAAEVASEQGTEKSAEQEEGWQEFTSEEGNFSVLMPGTPELSQTINESPVGDIEENNYSLKKKKMDFSVAYLDLPLLARIFGKKIILKRAKRGLLKEEKGEEISFVNIKQEGLRGAELIYETRKQKGKARFIVKKKKLYVLVVTIPKKSDEDVVMDKFLNSFKVFKMKHKPHKYRAD